MNIAQNFPYLVPGGAATRSMGGSDVLHAELTRASLRFGAADAVHMFVESVDEHAAAAIAALREEVDEARVALFRPAELPVRACHEPYVQVVRAQHAAGLAMMRSAAGHSAPICAIVHAVPGPGFLPFYVEAALCLDPCDVLVTSSRAALRALDHLLDAGRDLVRTRAGGAVATRPRTLCIPHGVDEEQFAPRDRSASACRAELGFPQEARLLLYLGRLTERYKADLAPLLRVLGRLRRGRPDVQLVLAGHDGDRYGARLMAEAAQQGMAEAVHLLTNFEHTQKPLIYGAADVFVSPVDNVQETFGLAVIEAMASGLPVVASDWSGYRDTIVPGQTGFLVPTMWNAQAAQYASLRTPLCRDGEYVIAQHTTIDEARLEQALAMLIDDEALRRRFGEQARRRVKSVYAWPHIAHAYGELWREQRDISARMPPARFALPTYDSAFRHYATWANDDLMERASALKKGTLAREAPTQVKAMGAEAR